jgi:hypothetical protein
MRHRLPELGFMQRLPVGKGVLARFPPLLSHLLMRWGSTGGGGCGLQHAAPL